LAGRQFLARLELPVDARERISVALEMIDLLEIQIATIERDLRPLARRQAGCQALIDAYYGIGELTAVTIVAELGDCRRFANSRDAVRYGDMDIGVHRSDRNAQLGKLTRQGSAPLRWALYEAAQSASHKVSPDYRDYHALKARGLSHTRALLTIARKLARRSYHILKALGPAALEPPSSVTKRSDQAHPSPMRSQRAASSRSDRGTHAQRGGPPKTERPQSLHRNDRSTIKSPAATQRGRGPR
jgi:transposase